MIIVKLSGRLGNHLFQIAAAKSLTSDVRVVFSSDFAKNDFLKYKESMFSTIKVVADEDCIGLPVIKEVSYAYGPLPSILPENFVLEGHFQSFKYFNLEIVHKLFVCPDGVSKDLKRRYGHLDSAKLVSINVRRGDYLKLPHRHPFCGLKYYQLAIEKFPNDSVFIVSSDDISWCKSKFRGNNFVFQEDSYPLLDLFVQSFCNHNILSNSSFSWWGAMFNANPNKIVIVPEKWYGIKLQHLPIDDLIPSSYDKVAVNQSSKDRIHAIFLYIKEMIKEQLGVLLKK